jgi:uncharacterized protein YdbL (DUF1318 family)
MRPIASLIFFASVLPVLTSSCVTVTVNFPESTVQKATDDYVKELYKAKEKGRATQKTPPAPQPGAGPGAGTGDPGKPDAPTSWLEQMNPIASAEAAEANLQFRTDTAKAVAIREKLAAHVSDVIAQKKAGNLGETSDGKLALKTDKPLLVKKLDSLVKQENDDREALYEEIQTANQMPKSRLADIRRSFARSFQSESPSGTWVQDQTGAWAQKP